jgi:putative ABC transport system permease protein
MVLQSSVSANFFRTMGISVKRGREFSEFDTEKTLRAAVVNETMVRSYWRGRNPLGSQLRHGLPDEPTAWYTVVGVVQDTLPLIGSHSVPEIFTPYTQVPEGYVNLLSRPLTVMVKVGAANASALVPDLQKAVTSVDASLTSDVRTMDGIVAHSLVDPKFRTVMIATFGTIAFWLSIIGTYGVISGFIAGEKRNIGIRTALGATPYSILMLFVRRGMTIVAIGIVLGLTLALSLLRIIRGVLYEVSPTDPMAFLLAVSVLFSASLVAVYLPASRTARVDPVEALREQ